MDSNIASNIALNIRGHRLYADFSKVKARLAQHQFVCWIAGGAVRDFCLAQEVNEFDLVTDATTETLKALFPEAILVGESFGVLKIPILKSQLENEFFDLATFRQESDYLDGRRPSKVTAATPVKDSERRDFTINAMFWDDVQSQVIDYQGGLFDLSRKHLVCVGDPTIRFTEDYLRIIRLVRFAAVLNFEIEPKTNQAALTYRTKINQISGERIWSELLKINKSKAFKFAFKQELFLELLKEFFDTKEITAPHVQTNVTNIMLLIYLLNPNIDFSEILKRRLKVSNQELEVYNSIRLIMVAVVKMSAAELAFEVEKNPNYTKLVEMLVEVQLIPEVVDQSIKKILSLNSKTLVTAKDLAQLIPNRYISEELKYLRISQFNGTYKTTDQALDYLNKKYALKNEKP